MNTLYLPSYIALVVISLCLFLVCILPFTHLSNILHECDIFIVSRAVFPEAWFLRRYNDLRFRLEEIGDRISRLGHLRCAILRRQDSLWNNNSVNSWWIVIWRLLALLHTRRFQPWSSFLPLESRISMSPTFKYNLSPSRVAGRNFPSAGLANSRPPLASWKRMVKKQLRRVETS